MSEQGARATVSAQAADGTLRAAIAGEIDLSNRAEIATSLARAWADAGADAEAMDLDLSSVSFMDSQAIALLHALHENLSGQRKVLRIRTGSGTPAESILALTGMQHLLDIRDL